MSRYGASSATGNVLASPPPPPSGSPSMPVRDSVRDSISDPLGIVKRGWWKVCICALVVSIVCLGLSVLQTPIYRSDVTLYVTSATDTNSQSAYQGSLASQQRVGSYSRLVTSDVVVERALSDSALGMSPEDAKLSLTAKNSPDTVLLTISAEDPDPLVAASLANAVAQAMAGYVATLETPANGGGPLAKLTIVSPATPSTDPVSPQVTRNTAIGLLIGILIGLLWVFVRSRFDTKIRSAEDLKLVSDVSLLASILSDGRLKDQKRVDFSSGASQNAEAYRRLKSNLGFISVDDPSRRILVTSAKPGEGKTTTSLNLAAAIADAGSSVVLVSADLRRPALGNWLAINNSIGFTDYLRGDLALPEVVQSTHIDGFSIVACGSVPPNPTELLASNKAGVFFDELASKYDYVVVDSAPILPVTDSLELTRWVDGVLVVTRSGWTRRPELSAALEQLKTAHVRVLGLVLNDVSESLTAYGYGYYGGDYSARPNG